MNTARLAGIPIDHVVAEVAAFPLSSEAALQNPLSEFDPGLSGATRALWRAAERHILSTFPSFSIEEAVTIRDRIWFDLGDEQRVSLWRYLRQLAREYLKPRGDEAVPSLLRDRAHEGPPDRGSDAVVARRRWRWVSFALPPDLLLAALGHGGTPRWATGARGDRATSPTMPGSVEFISPALDRILRDQGYAETHCHIGAAVEFPVLWVGAMRALASFRLDPDRFASPGSLLEEGRDLADWLIRAAVARYVLAAFLVRGRGKETFVVFLERFRDRFEARGGPVDYALLLSALGDLHRGTLRDSGLSFREWQDLYARMTDVNSEKDPRRLSMVQWADPVSDFFAPLGHHRPTPEMRFVGAGLEYLEAMEKAGATDSAFAQLFWQTLRIRTLFYRHVVQRPMTPGLQWFIRFYGRIKTARGPLEPLMFSSAEEVGGVRRGLRSLEVRTSPDPNQSALLTYVRRFAEHARRRAHQARRAGARPCEYGLVLHFTKDRGGNALQGYPGAYGVGSSADPRAAGGYRFLPFYAGKRLEALSFAWVLRSFPLSLQVLRGLDVCTDELGVPTWVLIPLIRHVQEAGLLASRLLRQELDLDVPPLGNTVHVGEDFVHLLSGLRRVDEAIRHVGLREGDRVGHAVALGVDPREWAGRGGLIPVPREERLLDLVWEWNWYARGDVRAPGGRLPRLEREIFRLAGLVFPRRRVFEAHLQLDRLVQDLHDPEQLRAAGFPSGPLPLVDKEDFRLGLLVEYLTSPEVFRRGREIEWIDPAADGESLTAIQAGLRRRVADLGITVEVNPSSNLLIGDLQDLRRHPLWRLRPPQGGDDMPPVSVCIGSDDPLTFATNLPEEYQLVQDALVSSGLGEEDSRLWLERTRASGMETRFTLPRISGRPIVSWSQTDDFPLPL
jgi:hypothetical protein